MFVALLRVWSWYRKPNDPGNRVGLRGRGNETTTLFYHTGFPQYQMVPFAPVPRGPYAIGRLAGVESARPSRPRAILVWLGAFEIYFLTVEDGILIHTIGNYVEDILGLPPSPCRVRFPWLPAGPLGLARKTRVPSGRPALDERTERDSGGPRPSP